MTVVPRNVAILWVAGVMIAAPAFAIDVRKIAGSVDSGPGAIAWSPDSQQVVSLTAGQLRLLRTTADTVETLPLKDVTAVSWAPGTDLLVVRTIASGSVVEQVNPSTGRVTALMTPGPPVGCRWLSADKALVSIEDTKRMMTIGTLVRSPLVVLFGGEVTPIYVLDAILPTRAQGVDYLSGWTSSGVHPAIGDILVSEYHDPPAFDPFLLFKMVDPAGGPAFDLFRLEGRRFTASASWSPDGTRVAASDDLGRLHVWTAGNEKPQLVESVTAHGQRPAWNPAAELIHIGGLVVTPDGELVHDVAGDSADATGTWSPDGRSLLVASKNGLTLATGFEVATADPAISDIASKMKVLRRLFGRGLIEEEDYSERKLKLLTTIGLTR